MARRDGHIDRNKRRAGARSHEGAAGRSAAAGTAEPQPSRAGPGEGGSGVPGEEGGQGAGEGRRGEGAAWRGGRPGGGGGSPAHGARRGDAGTMGAAAHWHPTTVGRYQGP